MVFLYTKSSTNEKPNTVIQIICMFRYGNVLSKVGRTGSNIDKIV